MEIVFRFCSASSTLLNIEPGVVDGTIEVLKEKLEGRTAPQDWVRDNRTGATDIKRLFLANMTRKEEEPPKEESSIEVQDRDTNTLFRLRPLRGFTAVGKRPERLTLSLDADGDGKMQLRLFDYAAPASDPVRGLSVKVDQGHSIYDLPAEEKDRLVMAVQSTWRPWTRSQWITSPPSYLELDDPADIIQACRKHLAESIGEKAASGIEITGASHRLICYHPDSSFAPEGWNVNHSDVYEDQRQTRITGKQYCVRGTGREGWLEYNPKSSDKPGNRVVFKTKEKDLYLYIGPAWAIRFTLNGEDVLGENIVHVYPTDLYLQELRKFRPDLIPTWNPPGDLVFICSHWCERQGHYMKTYGIIDLYGLPTKTLALWILSSLSTKTHEVSRLPGVKIY